MIKTMMALACAAALSTPAVAQTVVGTTSAKFINPQPSNETVTGVGTSSFTYGQADPTTNKLSFTGTSFSSLLNTPFDVGTLSYTNGTTVSNTVPLSVNLALAFNFTAPPAGSEPASTFTLDLVSTPNTGNAAQNADYVYFPSMFSNSSFTYGGATYTISLTGFKNVVGDGFLASNDTEFHVLEGGSAHADLFAKITAVPEPGSWAMMIAGIGLVGMALRRQMRRSEEKFDAKIKRITAGEALA